VNWPGIDPWNPWIGSGIVNHTTSTFVIMIIEVATVEGCNLGPIPHLNVNVTRLPLTLHNTKMCFLRNTERALNCRRLIY
jgi:hypothetical protein